MAVGGQPVGSCTAWLHAAIIQPNSSDCVQEVLPHPNLVEFEHQILNLLLSHGVLLQGGPKQAQTTA
jgi:hypothetical protein